MKAIWRNEIIAQSNETLIVEDNHYFPNEAVNKKFLRKNNTTTHCHWKGTASYYDIVVGDKVNESAAWYYPEPLTAAENIRDRIAFWKGIEVVN